MKRLILALTIAGCMLTPALFADDQKSDATAKECPVKAKACCPMADKKSQCCKVSGKAKGTCPMAKQDKSKDDKKALETPKSTK